MALRTLIEPYYPKRYRPGHQPSALATLLRIHCLQQWYALPDPAMEETSIDAAVTRRFAQPGDLDDTPEKTTVSNFHRLLETHDLAGKRFRPVNAHLRRKGLRPATSCDATVINAAPTKHPDGERNPSMHPAKQGHRRGFRMKAQLGVEETGVPRGMRGREHVGRKVGA